MAKEVTPFLMFPGGAEAAMNFDRCFPTRESNRSYVTARIGRARPEA